MRKISEALRYKFLFPFRKKTAFFRKIKLYNKNFTIISNNCWGGMVYDSYHIMKQSPTIGLFMMPEDYINFVENLPFLATKSLQFISLNESKHKDKFITEIKYPIARIAGSDIEIFFMHYSNQQEAAEKWYRRCSRINFNNILIKFNDQNDCTMTDIERFLNLNYDYKILFTSVKRTNFDNEFVIKNNPYITHVSTAYEPIGENKYFNVTEYLNMMNRGK